MPEPSQITFSNSQILCKEFFVILAGHGGIALLRLAEQAFFGGEQGAVSVDIDGAAFEDDAGFAVDAANFRDAGCFGHAAADFFIVLIVRIFCPGVEAPFDGGELRGQHKVPSTPLAPSDRQAVDARSRSERCP